MQTKLFPFLCAAAIATQMSSSVSAQAPFSFQRLHSFGFSNNVGQYPGPLTRGADGRLYGATEVLAAVGVGTIYRLDTNGANPEVIHRFASDGTGFSTQKKLVYARDGLLYGWAHTPGDSTGGALFRVEPSGTNFQMLLTAQQAQTTGWRELVDGSDNHLYAIGGTRLVRVNRDGTGFAPIHTNVTGSVPDQLFEGSDRRLYVVEAGAPGLIYRIDPNGSNRTVVRDFGATPIPGTSGPRAVFEASNGSLYGALSGISGAGPIKPKIFRMNPDGSNFVIVRELDTFPEGGLTYGNIIDALIEGSDGLLYGSVPNSGLHKPGYAFRMNDDGTGFTNLFDFPATYLAFDAGVNVNRSTTKFLVEGADGRLHGTTRGIGTADGALYRFQRDGSAFETVFSFETSTGQGRNVDAALSQGTNGVFYGTARNGGDGDNGTVFRINADGSGFTVLKTFASTSQGANPVGVTVGSDGSLYGATASGGSAGFGTVFKLNPDGSGFATLYSFLSTGADGRMPQTPPIEGNDGAFYGTTTFGGGAGAGTVFKLEKNGSGYTILHRFTNSVSGSNVVARLHEGSDGRLYGTAVFGGPQGGGTVFALSKAGGGLTPLQSFSSSGVGLRNPRGALAQSPDGTIFGTTTAGGTAGFGGIFKVQTNGTGFQVRREFSSTGGDGRAPEAGVAFGSDGLLYGVTRFGGGAINGSIYRLASDGAGYEKLRAFTGTNGDGGNPISGLIRGADGALYGTTSAGGDLGFGTLFRSMFDSVSPQLFIQAIASTALRITWPDSAAAFHLESNTNLANGLGWLPIAEQPALTNGMYSVTVTAVGGAVFYRLARP